MKLPESVRLSLLVLVGVCIGVALLAWLPLLPAADAAMVRASLEITLTRVPLALSILLFTLKAMDWMMHWSFSDALAVMKESPNATAIYHAARILAVCYLLGALFGS